MDRDGWNQRYDAAELVWTAGPNATFARLAEGLEVGRALDLGAGEGRNAIWLAARGWEATAVDFSDVALDKASQLAAHAGVELATVVADVAEYVPESEFDLVAVVYLHLPASARTTVYRRAARAVAPGGTLIVLGHDTTNVAEGYGGPQDPDVLFAPDDVATDVAGTGLIVDRSERVRREVQAADGEHVAIDALLVARRPPG
jgi:SAM-dependent methyltransferase